MDRSEWLNQRRTGIGGSDVAPILGVSKFRSCLDVYLDKIGATVDTEETSPMRWGTLLEPVILNEFLYQTGESLAQNPGFLRSHQHEFMVANLDGLTQSGAIIECKTARSTDGWGEVMTDEIPIYYITQVQHYMAVTGAELTYVPALIGGSDFRIYKVEADKDLQEMMIEKESQFWNQVVNKIQPDPVSEMDLSKLYPKSLKNAIEGNSEIYFKIGLLSDINSQIKELEVFAEQHRTELKQFMQDHDAITMDGKPLITYKSTKEGKKIDWQSAFESAKDYIPEIIRESIISKNTKTTESYRRFLIK